MKKIIFFFCGVSILHIGCAKNDASAKKPEQKAPVSQSTPDQPKVNSNEEDPAIKKNKYLKDKAPEDPDSQIAKLKQEINKLNLELKKNAKVSELATEAREPMDQMFLDLKDGKTVPILILSYGNSGDELVGLQNAIFSIDPGASTRRYVHIVGNNKSKNFGMFLAISSSLDGIEKLVQYTRQLDNRVMLVPIKNAISRSFMRITYKKNVLVGGGSFTKTFWIGDSKVFDFREATSDLGHISSYLPYLKDCESVDAHCLTALVNEGYFKSLTLIDGKSQYPLEFLAQELGQQAWLANQTYSSANPLISKIENIEIIHRPWMIASNLANYQDLLEFKDAYGSNIIDKSDNRALYELPLEYEIKISTPTNDEKLNSVIAIVQLHDYICFVAKCLPEKK